MNDLLNEDEFFPKEYNPRRWFLIFYLAGIGLTALVPATEYLLRIETTDLSASIVLIMLALIPSLSSMVMILPGKNVILRLKPNKAALKILIMHVCCYLTFACFLAAKMILDEIYTINEVYGFIIFVILYLIVYAITVAIILPILKRSQKINSLPQ